MRHVAGPTVREGASPALAHAPSLTVGPAKAPSLTVGPANAPSLTVGPANTPSLTVGPANTPSLTVGPAKAPSLTVGPANAPSAAARCGYTIVSSATASSIVSFPSLPGPATDGLIQCRCR